MAMMTLLADDDDDDNNHNHSNVWYGLQSLTRSQTLTLMGPYPIVPSLYSLVTHLSRVNGVSASHWIRMMKQFER